MIIHAELLTYKEEAGGYIIYVFRDLDVFNKYIMCTRFPRWETPPINIGDKGYLNYMEIIAGRDQWYNKEERCFIHYNYNGIQFINFVPEKPDIKDEIVL